MRRPLNSQRRPVIADRNAATAAANIEVKLRYLTAQVEIASKDASAHSVLLAALPKSQSQFNKWTSAGMPASLNVPPFTSNAPQTLRLATHVVETVKIAVVQVLRLRTAVNKQPYRKLEKIERVAILKREIRLLKAMKEIAERELAKYQSQVEEIRTELQTLSAQNESDSREFKSVILKMRSQLVDVTKKHLLREASKVVLIKQT